MEIRTVFITTEVNCSTSTCSHTSWTFEKKYKIFLLINISSWKVKQRKTLSKFLLTMKMRLWIKYSLDFMCSLTRTIYFKSYTMRFSLSIMEKRGYLSNRTQQVRVDNFPCDAFIVSEGVPQGSPLAPFYYWHIMRAQSIFSHRPHQSLAHTIVH